MYHSRRFSFVSNYCLRPWRNVEDPVFIGAYKSKIIKIQIIIIVAIIIKYLVIK